MQEILYNTIWYTNIKIGGTILWFLIFIYPYIIEKVEIKIIKRIFTILFIYFITLMIFNIGTIHQSVIILWFMLSSFANYIGFWILNIMYWKEINQEEIDNIYFKNREIKEKEEIRIEDKIIKIGIYNIMILVFIYIIVNIRKDIEYTFIFI